MIATLSMRCLSTTSVGRESHIYREVPEIHQARFLTETGTYLPSDLQVSVDWDPEVGVGLLKPYGPFDELAVGANWENIGAVDYIWNDKGVGAIPQVVVLERCCSGFW